MAKQLFITSQAHRDILAIRDYIANDKPDTANKIAGKIYDGIERISEMPGLGIPLSAKFGIKTDIRFSILHLECFYL